MISSNLTAGQSRAQREDEAVTGRIENAFPDEESAPSFLPQNLGAVFDGAFDLYKRHFGTLALIVAIVFIPTQVVLHAMGNLWLRPLTMHLDGDNPDFLAAIQAFWLGFIIGVPGNGIPGYLSLLTSFMVSGPVAVAVANILLRRPVTIATVYQRALPVLWRLFWMWNILFLLFFFVSTGVVFVVAFTLGILSVTLSGIGAPEIGAAFLFLGIFLPYLSVCALGAILFSFTPPLIALENANVFSALSRNAQLVGKKLFLRTWFAVTLLPLLTFGLQFLILQSASSVIDVLHWPSWSGFVLNTGLSSLISFFFQPYWMIFIALLYFDARIRREGLDVRYMADNLPIAERGTTPDDYGLTAATMPAPIAMPVAVPSQSPAPAVNPLDEAIPESGQPGVPPLPSQPPLSERESV